MSLAAAIAVALLPAAAQADPTNEELLQKIEELSQKVLVLERKLEVQDDATKAARRDDTRGEGRARAASASPSADSQNQIKLRGVMHLDGRFFASDDPEGPARTRGRRPACVRSSRARSAASTISASRRTSARAGR